MPRTSKWVTCTTRTRQCQHFERQVKRMSGSSPSSVLAHRPHALQGPGGQAAFEFFALRVRIERHAPVPGGTLSKGYLSFCGRPLPRQRAPRAGTIAGDADSTPRPSSVTVILRRSWTKMVGLAIWTWVRYRMGSTAPVGGRVEESVAVPLPWGTNHRLSVPDNAND